MKFILVVLSALLPASAFTQYVFNFSSGKTSAWSNVVNWTGNTLPAGDVTTIIIAPPDTTTGQWTSIADIDDINCYDSLLVKAKATLIVPAGFTLWCRKNIVVEKGGELVVTGTLKCICPFYVNNKGRVKIEGSMNDDGSDCPALSDTSSIRSNGSFYIHGEVNLAHTMFSFYDSLCVKGSFRLFKDRINAFGVVINEGGWDGNAYLNLYGTMINKGVINIEANSFFNGGVYSHGYWYNGGNLTSTRTLYIEGVLLNSGWLEFSEGWLTIDSADIINKNMMTFRQNTEVLLPNHLSAISNSGTIDFQYVDKPFYFKANLVNNGDLTGGPTQFLLGSVINKGTMMINAFIESNIIKVPFINTGTLTTFGPTNLGESFINKGELISN